MKNIKTGLKKGFVKMKNLKMGLKLGLGFGGVLLLLCILSFFTLIQLREIAVDSVNISEEYMPELTGMSELDRNFREGLLNIRAFFLVEDEKAYEVAMKNFDSVKADLLQLKSLAEKNPELKDLANFVNDFEKIFNEYLGYVKQCRANVLGAANARTEMGPQARAAMENLSKASLMLQNDFLKEAQNGSIQNVPMRMKAILEVENLITDVMQVRLLVWQAQLTNDREKLHEVIKKLEEQGSSIAEILPLISKPEALALLNDVGKSATNYKALVGTMLQNWEEFAVIGKKRNDSFVQANEMITKFNISTSEMVTQITAANANNASAQQKFIGFLALTIIFIGIVIAFLLTKIILSPLHKGVEFAKSVAGGNFEARWQSDSKDELGQLAVALNAAFTKVADQAFWYESVLNSLPFYLAAMDKERRFIFVNKKVQEMLGKPLSEIIGQPCHIWGAPICQTENCVIERCVQGDTRDVLFSQSGVGEFKAKAVKMHDRQNKHTGYLDMVFDVAEEQRLKQEAENAIIRGRMETVAALEGIVEVVSSASNELSVQVEESKRGATSTAERITNTATAMEEMNSTVLEVARSASCAAQVSNDAKIKAEEGSQIVNTVVTCIADVEKQSTQLKMDMVQLSQQAESIGSIMNVIADIADQTNLLALNAAIEAARAGEAGRGFAVVADEVRKLAEKTMQATTEVDGAIRGVQHSVEQNMKNVDISSESILRATELVRDAGDSLKEIVHLVETAADQVCTIATAAEEQSSTSDEINLSLSSVDKTSTETAQVMADSAQAVSELSLQTQNLLQIIEDMKKT